MNFSICQFCGNEFFALVGQRRYCNNRCRRKATYQREKEKNYYTGRYRIEKQKWRKSYAKRSGVTWSQWYKNPWLRD